MNKSTIFKYNFNPKTIFTLMIFCFIAVSSCDNSTAQQKNQQLKKTGNKDLAEEISIITFARAFDRISTFNDQFKFKTWLLTISKNIYNDLLRKNNTKISLKTLSNSNNLQDFTKEDHPSPEEILITNESLESLLDKIRSLKQDYRKILQFRFFDGLSYKEISKMMDQPINTIKVKLLRAKNLLSEKIKEDAG